MSQIRMTSILLPFFTVFVWFCPSAFAYIDPNTTSPVFGVLAPSLSALLVLLGLVLFFLGFLFRPFRRFFRFLFNKIRGHSD